MTERILYKLDKVIMVIIFLLLIYIPFLAGIIQDDQKSSGIEKRNLAKMPLLPKSFEAWSDYPEKFNTYYSDHFGYREVLTKAYFKLENKLGNKTSIDNVTIGQDGWLFLGSIKRGYQKYNDPMGDAINSNLFSENELEKFSQSIVAIRDWLKNRGIEYIYVIAPNKHTIYFEYLPKYISKINDQSATDQLVAYLEEHTDVMVVDLRQALLDEKKKHQLYFKTDTHWNEWGANVGQFEIMKKIKHLFPEQISPFLLDDRHFKILPVGGGDLARLAKIDGIKEDKPKAIFKTGCIPVNETPDIKETETHTIVCEGKKIDTVIFRDSFFIALQPYISRQFHRSTYVWEKINFSSLTKYIEREKPDIVIDEVVERSLPYIPSSDFFKYNQ